MEQTQAVNVEIQSTIEDNGATETITVQERGEVYGKNDKYLVQYEENVEGQGKISNKLLIQPDKVSIKRAGVVKMNQLFRVGQRTENIYHHPYGCLYVDTFTSKIDYIPFTGKNVGQLVIEYTVSLNGEAERKHSLTMTLSC